MKKTFNHERMAVIIRIETELNEIGWIVVENKI